MEIDYIIDSILKDVDYSKLLVHLEDASELDK